MELPPRARRILTTTVPLDDGLGTTSACAENTKQVVERDIRIGTTSACAENTDGNQRRDADLRNYLRVRGEYPPVSHAH